MRDAKGKFCKARPFKVGDRVRGNGWASGNSYDGLIKGFDAAGDVLLENGICLSIKSIHLITDTPGPEFTLTTASAEREAVLIRERDEAREERDRLKADLEKANTELADAPRWATVKAYQGAVELANARAEASEAKLADIAALHRAMVLMADADNIHDAMGKVLDRGNLEAAS